MNHALLKKLTSSYSTLLLASLLAIPTSGAFASTITLNATDDGSLYTCNSCNPNPVRIYVLASGYIVGDVLFQSPTIGAGQTALLSVNPYALPLNGPTISVYGKATSSNTIAQSDTAGTTFLGTWTLPALGYGQAAYFDVTAFLKTVNAPFVDFTLETTGTDVFSSTANNLGAGPQLVVTSAAAPEPGTAGLTGIALATMATAGFLLRRRV